jgi:hypothetical protein
VIPSFLLNVKIVSAVPAIPQRFVLGFILSGLVVCASEFMVI